MFNKKKKENLVQAELENALRLMHERSVLQAFLGNGYDKNLIFLICHELYLCASRSYYKQAHLAGVDCQLSEPPDDRTIKSLRRYIYTFPSYIPPIEYFIRLGFSMKDIDIIMFDLLSDAKKIGIMLIPDFPKLVRLNYGGAAVEVKMMSKRVGTTSPEFKKTSWKSAETKQVDDKPANEQTNKTGRSDYVNSFFDAWNMIRNANLDELEKLLQLEFKASDAGIKEEDFAELLVHDKTRKDLLNQISQQNTNEQTRLFMDEQLRTTQEFERQTARLQDQNLAQFNQDVQMQNMQFDQMQNDINSLNNQWFNNQP